jgi:hypothetical protein
MFPPLFSSAACGCLYDRSTYEDGYIYFGYVADEGRSRWDALVRHDAVASHVPSRCPGCDSQVRDFGGSSGDCLF